MLLRSLIAPAQQKDLQHFVLPKINMETKYISVQTLRVVLLLFMPIFARLFLIKKPWYSFLALFILRRIVVTIKQKLGMGVDVDFTMLIIYTFCAVTSPYWVPAILRSQVIQGTTRIQDTTRIQGITWIQDTTRIQGTTKIQGTTGIQGWRWELVYWTVTATWIMYAMDTKLGYQLMVSHYSNSFYQRFSLTVLITKIAQFKDPFGWILLDVLAVAFTFNVKWTEKEDSVHTYGLIAIFHFFLSRCV
jgi:hypothetical protein